ncbi:MAG: tyrosine-type recombinase/integrase [Pseudomonadales bacterium]
MNTSDVHEQLEQYLALRRALGFQIRTEQRLLTEFVSSLTAEGLAVPIRAQTAVEWAFRSARHCQPAARSHRLGVARGFLRYLRAVFPDTEVPGTHLLASTTRPAPHIYTDTEIGLLIEGTKTLRSRGGLRPRTMVTLIGLLISTGLRAGEAIRLRLADVDLSVDPPLLNIQQTKFRKSRLVPLHPSTARALRKYSKHRRRVCDDGLCDRFFVSDKGKPLPYRTVSCSFVALTRRVGIRGPVGERGPSLHHLRHTFAVNRLIAWYRDSQDVNARIPELSVYLGHARPQNTYWYLSATAELLELAAQRFEVRALPGGSP